MKKIYFGPVRNVPSWYWVGRDIARYLSAAVQIRYFNTADDIEPGAVVFWVKAPPKHQLLEEIKKKRIKIIFFPVDQYRSDLEIKADEAFLDYCTTILLHSRSLSPLFSKWKTGFVNHYNKYGIEFASRSATGRALWVGGFQYVPYILHYLKQADLDMGIDLLTDCHASNAVSAANTLAASLNLDVDFTKQKEFPGLKIHQWSELAQRNYLQSCCVAFDYKYTSDFNQFHKPPTKIQKYIASGIPAAINYDSPIVEQMANEGFELCTPERVVEWRSKRYLLETISFAKELRRRLSIESTAASYMKFA